ncbi:unnamed protein product [Lota lota]
MRDMHIIRQRVESIRAQQRDMPEFTSRTFGLDVREEVYPSFPAHLLFPRRCFGNAPIPGTLQLGIEGGRRLVVSNGASHSLQLPAQHHHIPVRVDLRCSPALPTPSISGRLRPDPILVPVAGRAGLASTNQNGIVRSGSVLALSCDEAWAKRTL